VQASAFAIVERVAVRHGLARFEPPKGQREGWRVCFSGGGISLCGKTRGPETQFRLWQAGFSLSPTAERLRIDVMESLKSELGGALVRGCEWRGANPAKNSGCVPADSIPKAGKTSATR
jgi:hypothetical protein